MVLEASRSLLLRWSWHGVLYDQDWLLQNVSPCAPSILLSCSGWCCVATEHRLFGNAATATPYTLHVRLVTTIRFALLLGSVTEAEAQKWEEHREERVERAAQLKQQLLQQYKQRGQAPPEVLAQDS